MQKEFRKKESSLLDYALFFAPFELEFFFSNWNSGFALYTSTHFIML